MFKNGCTNWSKHFVICHVLWGFYQMLQLLLCLLRKEEIILKVCTWQLPLNSSFTCICGPSRIRPNVVSMVWCLFQFLHQNKWNACFTKSARMLAAVVQLSTWSVFICVEVVEVWKMASSHFHGQCGRGVCRMETCGLHLPAMLGILASLSPSSQHPQTG